MTEYVPALWASALYVLCGQQATLDAALLQDVLSLFPLGSHRVSATAFVDLSEAADGARTAEVGRVKQAQCEEGETFEKWERDGWLHRQGGPAWRSWTPEGLLVEEEWCIRGVLYRADGPAWRKWDEYGRLLTAQRWVRGIQIEG